jgi:ribokinase
VASGANRLLRPDDIRKHKHCIGESDTVLIQLEIPIETAYTGIEIASEADVPVILNPAPVPPEPLEDKYLGMVSYILPNRGELELITGGAEKEVEHAVDTLMGKGIGSVVVTMGNEGCYFRTGDLSGYVPAIEVESVDTVGAGDCFAGCFAAGLSDGMDIEKAVRFGTAGAALSVTKRGAQPSMPRLKETRKLLRLQKT